MIQLSNLSKSFTNADGTVEALKNINITINDGDIYGVIGMSGAGKSTLVRCINMLERPTSGTVVIDGKDIGALPEKQLRTERRKIAMIFQGFNLLMQKNCLQNVCFPLRLAGVKKQDAELRAHELLQTVGLADKAKAYPSQLSGGQQQRVAIARALATDPKVLLCDEATSALDPKTTRDILQLIRDINRQLHLTVVVITHQMSVVEEICNRVAILDSGEVVEEGEVSAVFSRPQSRAAKNIVFPEEDLAVENLQGQRVIRLAFDGTTAAGKPLIAQMAQEENIAANIIYASTRSIGNKVYGKMLLSLPDDDKLVARAVAYLNNGNIAAEEVSAKEVHNA